MHLRNLSIFIFVIAVTAVVSVSYVQHRIVPGGVETSIRTCTTLLGFLGCPALIPLSCWTWVRTGRNLSVWRNGLALSAIVLVSVVWLLHFGMAIAYQIHPFLSYFSNPDWLPTYLGSTFIAAALSIALKGPARFLVLSTALFLYASIQATVFFGRMVANSW